MSACENCDDVKCMDCVGRFGHDACADSCPFCCDLELTPESTARALRGADVTPGVPAICSDACANGIWDGQCGCECHRKSEAAG